MTISITKDNSGTAIYLVAPYRPQLPAMARKLGGKWNGTVKVWTFAATAEAAVRELCRKIYGWV